MRKSCCMVWVVFSTSSLLDQRGSHVTENDLNKMAEGSGYKLFRLQNIMRNTSNITTAMAPDNVNLYRSTSTTPSSAGISKSISVGSCSTVAGTRPICYLYKEDRGVDYEFIAEYVNHYLADNKTRQTVILCDEKISPKEKTSIFMTFRVKEIKLGIMPKNTYT